MKRLVTGSLAVVALMLLSSLGAADARADGPNVTSGPQAPTTTSPPSPPSPPSLPSPPKTPAARPVAQQTWGQATSAAPSGSSTRAGEPGERSDSPPTSPVRAARDLLTRARRLDDRAAVDEKAATELQQRLPALRASAKATRERAERATGPDREVLVAVAEDLETDLAISEAETTSKRREAEDDRLSAHELRSRAMRIIHGRPADASNPARLTPDGLGRDASIDTKQRDDHCDPPFRFTPDGRKTYLFECLK